MTRCAVSADQDSERQRKHARHHGGPSRRSGTTRKDGSGEAKRSLQSIRYASNVLTKAWLSQQRLSTTSSHTEEAGVNSGIGIIGSHYAIVATGKRPGRNLDVITDDTAWLLVEACRLLDKPMKGLTICELGNQHPGWAVRISAISGENVGPNGSDLVAVVPIKFLMEWLGASHTSIDQNGQDGSVALDLSKPLPSHWHGQYDLVTNYGTTEHVFTSGDLRDQWQAFKSIHELTRLHGIIVHVVPNERGAHNGCGYVYADDFMLRLAHACGYCMHHHFRSKSDHEHQATVFSRLPESRFPLFEEFEAIGGILRADGTAAGCLPTPKVPVEHEQTATT